MLAASLLLGACSDSAAPPSSAAARHVVVVCIDTLRPDHVGAYGHSRPTTPHVDGLARGGARFATAYAHSNWTVPATASLLTSLYPAEHGAGLAGDVRNLDDGNVLQLRDGVETLAARLGRSGFRSGLFSANPFLFGPFQRGFDKAEVRRQSAGELTDAALQWLEENTGQRVFLYLQYMDLHHPIEPPPPYGDMFPAAEGGPRGREHAEWSFARVRSAGDLEDPAFHRYRAHKLALYDGALRYVDEQIGRLLSRLEDLGLADETLVVVTADHGEEFWDHAVAEAGHPDPRGIWGIGHGHTMYEELLRVPLVFHGPRVPAGTTSPCVARHLDVVPTVLELLGLPRADGVRGTSLLEAMRASSAASCPAVPVIAESPAYGPDSQAVIWRGRKLITRKVGGDLLFDLREDAGEQHDLAAAQPALAAGLRTILQRELAGAGALGPSEAMEFDEATRAELRALGYLR